MNQLKKIDRENIEDIIAMTPMQEGMLFHYLQDPGSDYYFERLSLDIPGEIDIDIFAKAWNFVIETNEMLRTVFRWQDVENPVQIILKAHHISPGYHDFSREEPGERQKRLEAVIFNRREKKFDLQDVPFRINLFKLEHHRYRLIISNHHILYDGWSTGIILKEFFKAYDDLSKGKNLEKREKTRFKEFIHWVRGQEIEGQEKYWRSYLEGIEAGAQLPVKRKKPVQVNHNKIYCWKQAKEKTAEITGFLKKHQLTLASLLYTAWGILLQKYHNSHDVVFGTTVSGRSAKLAGIEDMVGLFINTLPLRTWSAPHDKAVDLLKRMERDLHLRQNHEHSSLVNIRKWSEIGKGQELFDTLIVLENYPLENRLTGESKGIAIDTFDIFEMTHYDLTVTIGIFAELTVKVIYPGDLFTDESIERLVGHFAGIVEMLMENPGQLTAEIEIISKEEKKKLLYDFNDTQAGYPAHKTIHRLFAEQVDRTPDYTALLGPQPGNREGSNRSHWSDMSYISITYRELHHRSHEMARVLMGKGGKPGTIAGIMVERSIEMIIGILGILKAGGAYMPIDPDYPQERKQYMINDSKSMVLLTAPAINEALNRSDKSHMSYNSPGPAPAPHHPSSTLASTLTCRVSPGNLAYVIYTSGTTGTPKGVMVEHSSVVNILAALQKKYPLQETDAYLLKTSYVFDVSVTELFGWYLGGGRLVILEKEGEKNPGKIMETVERTAVTHMNFVPSMFQAFTGELTPGNISKLSTLKYIFLAGEALQPGMVNKFRRLNTSIQLENIYGPTEGTVYTAHYSLSGWDGKSDIPIGKPLQNIRLYILDKDRCMQPPGLPGELYISGVCLARGYINRPGLTARSFGLYRSYRSNKSYILYHTGDLARWAADGNIEFLGRMDSQVKIRGFRVELAEIESCLSHHEDIKEAVVMVSEGAHGENHLCAFITAGRDLAVPGLKTYLAKKLPAYMIPAYFKQIEKIPLTPSGKIDRKALLSTGTARQLETGTVYVPAAGEIEKTIAGIWKELVETEKFGVHDNFFDIGGNSLTIIRLNSRLKKAFARDIPMAAMFNYPTIHAMAAYLRGRERDKDKAEPGTRREAQTGEKGLEIAIIGMACRFPGAKDIDEFWNNIKNGVESIGFFTREKLSQLGVETESMNDPDYVPAKGVLDSKAYFDSFFFGYTPPEVEMLDPQVRVFHECTWEALENAGYDPFSYDGTIGLYAGASPNPLWEISPLTSGAAGGSYPELWNAIQFSDKDYLSTRIAYKLDLRGPCVTIQTACSTSLTAVDQACRALVSGACTMVLAGGVSVTFQDEGGYLYQEGTIMSPDGHCRAFDAGAKGTVGGNGVGVVVLKRLQEAAADGDTIYAVIKGFAINNDGKNKVGFTAPSSEGQSKAIRDALDMAGANPGSIGYIETHGTGTLLGDPIEIEGLKMAFNGVDPRKKQYCALGSVKTNIGHLDAAAGIAGFIKTVLSLYHRSIPPSLHFESPNPRIDFENSPFYVNTGLKTWESNEYPLRAGVSSFGLGGTNVHVVLEEWTGDSESVCRGVSEPVNQCVSEPVGQWVSASVNQCVGEPVRKCFEGTGGLAPLSDRQYHLILLSARTETALDKMTQNLSEYLKETTNPGQNPGIQLADAAYTLQVGRKAFAHRKMLVCADKDEALRKLQAGEVETGTIKEGKPTIVFMFSGQGSQYVNMGLNLYREEPVFRGQVDECFELLENIAGIDMKPVLYPGEGTITIEEAEEKIFQFKYTTPIKFIFEYSLAKVFMKWGIQPDAMIGHSFGEYAAACLAGVFSLEDAVFMAALRGRSMHQLPPGTMLSVPLSEEELKPLLTDEISLAAVNGESMCVVSGPEETIADFERRLNEKGHECLRYRVPKAGHSRMVEPIMAEFKEKIARVKFNKPRIPFISGMSGKWITAAEVMDPEYWTRHLRETVRFADGLSTLLAEPHPVFLQVGPGTGLTMFVNRHPAVKPGIAALNMVRHSREKISDVYYTLKQIGQLWLHGIPVTWREFYPGEKRRRIPLPGYPFEGNYYPPPQNLFKTGPAAIPGAAGVKPLLTQRTDIADWFYIPVWEQAPYPPRGAGKPGNPLESSHWLVFMDELGLGERLVKELDREKIPGTVITVRAGEAYAREKENAYLLNPAQPGEYDRLLEELRATGREPHRVIHLWSVLDDQKYPGGLETLEMLQDLGFHGMLNLVRALGRENSPLTREIQIKVVTNHLYSVIGEEETCPGKATIRGAVKVIPLEYNNINCTHIDIDWSGPDSKSTARLIGQLLAEFTRGSDSDSPDNIVAIRGTNRWREVMRPVRLEKCDPVVQRLKEQGVYLITGGLGGMGFTFAQYLARDFRAKLILVRRSFFPAPGNWDQWLETHPQEDEVGAKIRKIRELEEIGAEIMVCCADVADEEQMREVIAEAHRRFGPINGVLHTAGLGDYAGLIQQRTREMTDRVMAPKVRGTLVLDRLLNQDRLDFLVLFSSIGNIIYQVKFAQVGYNAANEFLEAFAHYKTCKDGTYTVTINWNDWLEVGMSIEATDRKYRKHWEYKYGGELAGIDYESAIHGGIMPGQGVEILQRVLGQELERVTVSRYDLEGMVRLLRSLVGREAETFDAIEERLAGSGIKERPPLAVPYQPATNRVEQILAAIWSNYFGIAPIGIDDDFFELGGDSLKAMVMIHKIHKELEFRLPLTEFFNNPTVKGQADYIGKAGNQGGTHHQVKISEVPVEPGEIEHRLDLKKGKYAAIEHVEKKDYYGLSSAQKRFYIGWKMQPGSISYNLTQVLVLEGKLQKERFQQAFHCLINRHETLRTSFREAGEETVQVIHDQVKFDFIYRDFPGVQVSVERFIRPFDLSTAPLLRVELTGTGEDEHVLMLDMHHIISDAVSQAVMIKEMMSLFREAEQPLLKIQYKDYTCWQDKMTAAGQIARQETYWLEQLSGYIHPLDFPADYPRPALKNPRADILLFQMNPKLTSDAKQWAVQTGTTLSILLMAVFKVLLFKYTGREDMVVGTGIAGRTHTDLDNLIGIFINLLALRSQPSPGKTFREFLAELRQTALSAYENQDYPFEELVNKLGIPRQPGRHPLFEIEFTFQNVKLEKIEIPGLTLKPYTGDWGHKEGKFDISLQAKETGDVISFTLLYLTAIFKPSTMESLAAHFIEILGQVLENPHSKLHDIVLSIESSDAATAYHREDYEEFEF